MDLVQCSGGASIQFIIDLIKLHILIQKY